MTSRPSNSWSTTPSTRYEQAQPFNWYRGYQVGGRSLMWSRHVFRYSDLDFEANLKEGVGIDWPIRYADIAPWYEYVEKFIGASGENPGLPQLPKQILQPPFEMTALEKHIKREFEKEFTDRQLICSSIAVLSREHNGRGPCQGRNQCARGCPYSAYFSSNGVTLPAAAATGNLTLQPDSRRAFADLRRSEEPRDRRARDRREHAQDHRVLRARGVPVRVDAEFHRHPAQHASAPLSQWTRQ